jgi:hypothetical protein
MTGTFQHSFSFNYMTREASALSRFHINLNRLTRNNILFKLKVRIEHFLEPDGAIIHINLFIIHQRPFFALDTVTNQ